jgi:hypothetical protein
MIIFLTPIRSHKDIPDKFLSGYAGEVTRKRYGYQIIDAGGRYQRLLLGIGGNQLEVPVRGDDLEGCGRRLWPPTRHRHPRGLFHAAKYFPVSEVHAVKVADRDYRIRQFFAMSSSFLIIFISRRLRRDSLSFSRR